MVKLSRQHLFSGNIKEFDDPFVHKLDSMLGLFDGNDEGYKNH